MIRQYLTKIDRRISWSLVSVNLCFTKIKIKNSNHVPRVGITVCKFNLSLRDVRWPFREKILLAPRILRIEIHVFDSNLNFNKHAQYIKN